MAKTSEQQALADLEAEELKEVVGGRRNNSNEIEEQASFGGVYFGNVSDLIRQHDEELEKLLEKNKKFPGINDKKLEEFKQKFTPRPNSADKADNERPNTATSNNDISTPEVKAEQKPDPRWVREFLDQMPEVESQELFKESLEIQTKLNDLTRNLSKEMRNDKDNFQELKPNDKGEIEIGTWDEKKPLVLHRDKNGQITPPLNLEAGQGPLTLSFAHKRNNNNENMSEESAVYDLFFYDENGKLVDIITPPVAVKDFDDQPCISKVSNLPGLRKQLRQNRESELEERGPNLEQANDRVVLRERGGARNQAAKKERGIFATESTEDITPGGYGQGKGAIERNGARGAAAKKERGIFATESTEDITPGGYGQGKGAIERGAVNQQGPSKIEGQFSATDSEDLTKQNGAAAVIQRAYRQHQNKPAVGRQETDGKEDITPGGYGQGKGAIERGVVNQQGPSKIEGQFSATTSEELDKQKPSGTSDKRTTEVVYEEEKTDIIKPKGGEAWDIILKKSSRKKPESPSRQDGNWYPPLKAPLSKVEHYSGYTINVKNYPPTAEKEEQGSGLVQDNEDVVSPARGGASQDPSQIKSVISLITSEEDLAKQNAAAIITGSKDDGSGTKDPSKIRLKTRKKYSEAEDITPGSGGEEVLKLERGGASQGPSKIKSVISFTTSEEDLTKQNAAAIKTGSKDDGSGTKDPSKIRLKTRKKYSEAEDIAPGSGGEEVLKLERGGANQQAAKIEGGISVTDSTEDLTKQNAEPAKQKPLGSSANASQEVTAVITRNAYQAIVASIPQRPVVIIEDKTEDLVQDNEDVVSPARGGASQDPSQIKSVISLITSEEDLAKQNEAAIKIQAVTPKHDKENTEGSLKKGFVARLREGVIRNNDVTAGSAQGKGNKKISQYADVIAVPADERVIVSNAPAVVAVPVGDSDLPPPSTKEGPKSWVSRKFSELLSSVMRRGGREKGADVAGEADNSYKKAPNILPIAEAQLVNSPPLAQVVVGGEHKGATTSVAEAVNNTTALKVVAESEVSTTKILPTSRGGRFNKLLSDVIVESNIESKESTANLAAAPQAPVIDPNAAKTGTSPSGQRNDRSFNKESNITSSQPHTLFGKPNAGPPLDDKMRNYNQEQIESENRFNEQKAANIIPSSSTTLDDSPSPQDPVIPDAKDIAKGQAELHKMRGELSERNAGQKNRLSKSSQIRTRVMEAVPPTTPKESTTKRPEVPPLDLSKLNKDPRVVTGSAKVRPFDDSDIGSPKRSSTANPPLSEIYPDSTGPGDQVKITRVGQSYTPTTNFFHRAGAQAGVGSKKIADSQLPKEGEQNPKGYNSNNRRSASQAVTFKPMSQKARDAAAQAKKSKTTSLSPINKGSAIRAALAEQELSSVNSEQYRKNANKANDAEAAKHLNEAVRIFNNGPSADDRTQGSAGNTPQTAFDARSLEIQKLLNVSRAELAATAKQTEEYREQIKNKDAMDRMLLISEQGHNAKPNNSTSPAPQLTREDIRKLEEKKIEQEERAAKKQKNDDEWNRLDSVIQHTPVDYGGAKVLSANHNRFKSGKDKTADPDYNPNISDSVSGSSDNERVVYASNTPTKFIQQRKTEEKNGAKSLLKAASPNLVEGGGADDATKYLVAGMQQENPRPPTTGNITPQNVVRNSTKNYKGLT